MPIRKRWEFVAPEIYCAIHCQCKLERVRYHIPSERIKARHPRPSPTEGAELSLEDSSPQTRHIGLDIVRSCDYRKYIEEHHNEVYLKR